MTEKATVSGTPADPTARYTTLELAGKTFYLCYDFDAIAKAEQLTGMPLLFGVDWSHIDAKRMRAMLCAAMLKAQPDTKPEDLTRYFTHRNVLMIQNAIIEAWLSSTPEPEEDGSKTDPQTPDPSPAD
jgi:hypothetical protein